MTLETTINAAAAIGQCLAALLAVVALIVSLRTAREQMKLTETIAEDQKSLMFEQVRMHRDTDILAWTAEGTAALSDAEHLMADIPAGPEPPPGRERRRALASRLSTLVDHGRLFFPNNAPDKKGKDKPAAYQGTRQRILGVLVGAYHLLEKSGRFTGDKERADAAARFNDFRRAFVSEAQLTIDPRRYIAIKEMNEIRLKQGVAPQSPQEKDPNEGGA